MSDSKDSSGSPGKDDKYGNSAIEAKLSDMANLFSKLKNDSKEVKKDDMQAFLNALNKLKDGPSSLGSSVSPSVAPSAPGGPAVPAVKESKYPSYSSGLASAVLTESQLNYGVDYSTYQTLPSRSLMNMLNCEYCDKYFKKVSVVEYDGAYVCHHCFMWVNYAEDKREIVEDVFGLSIAEYVLQYKDTHDGTKCTRKGCCFICDNLNGIPITKIKNPELICQKPDDDDIEVVLTDEVFSVTI